MDDVRDVIIIWLLHIYNKFIEDEPKISRPLKENFEPIKEKTEFFSPVKKAKQSLDSTAMPVSETLAKIFAVQGNYPKAIYAYEQLCLIYPEKKIFFASQIEELKQKTRNNKNIANIWAGWGW